MNHSQPRWSNEWMALSRPFIQFFSNLSGTDEL